MKENPEKESSERRIPRRDLLRLTIAGSGAVAAGALLPRPAPAQSVDMKDKRRARYQADSAEVRDFYRVNSYPGAR
ncbi:formate dehydrogenase [Bradyrhizobium sp. CNPSo 4026]|nr:formate dehydrogenase [Bradyrhizobium cenepequi]